MSDGEEQAATAARVREKFAAQPFMKTIGARLAAVRPGEVEIELPHTAAIRQHSGCAHAAALTAILDNACGFAAMTHMGAGDEVLTVEFKVNFMSPGAAPLFLAVGRVKRAGRRLTVVEGEVFGVEVDGARKVCAVMLATMIAAPAGPQ